MDPEEFDIDEALVRRLLAAQFPRWSQIPVAEVRSAGTDNAIYRLGTDLAVRLPHLRRAADTVGTETRWLPRLGPLLPFAVPEPLGRGEPDEEFPYPWWVCRWLPGHNLADRPDVDLPDVAVRLGRFVAALRHLDATGGRRRFAADRSARSTAGSVQRSVTWARTAHSTRTWQPPRGRPP